MKTELENDNFDNKISDEMVEEIKENKTINASQNFDEFNSQDKYPRLFNKNCRDKIRNGINANEFPDNSENDKIEFEKSKNNGLNAQSDNDNIKEKNTIEEIDPLVKTKITIMEDVFEPILKLKIFCEIYDINL